MEQRVRFCRSADGVQVAFARHGHGPPLVRAATWLTHLEFDWKSPVWRHWLEELGRGHTVVRYDERGCGLSDRDVGSLSLDAWVGDLEAVVDAAGVERFALLGISQGGPVAVAYAVRHPDRVSRLVLYGSYARGRLHRDPSPEAREEAALLQSLIRVGWGRANPAFRRAFTTLFIPGATSAQMDWFDELQRVSSSPDVAVRIRRARNELDVADLAQRLSIPTLILHSRADAVVPFAEGRLLATLIPDARFVALSSENHIVLADEPAWAVIRDTIAEFLEGDVHDQTPLTHQLSRRELAVLGLVAEGCGNEGIAARLHLSVRTVERHLSNIYTKLGVSGRSARAAAAARYAQLTPGSE
jgi:pimeloyl-ACP methyl ester carboxylesterase/DNA-binding CsgD family transcriptional regulator